LLVEDNPRDAELTLAALAESSIANEVVVTCDGAEALDYLYRRGKFTMRPHGNPAVIFLDLKLPKVDGVELLRQVKGDSELKTIPVVMMTCSREAPDLARSYALGANAYIVKPLDFQSFVTAVKETGAFWRILNEPAGSVRQQRPASEL
jgi:CheY-like chemotaxis protein